MHLSAAGQNTFEEINRLRKSQVTLNNDEQKMHINDTLKLQIEAFLNSENSFDTAFPPIQFIGDLFSPDKAFRMITWNLTMQNGTYKYFCYVQQKDGTWHALIDQHLQIQRSEYRSLKYTEWYGALYYHIIPFTYKKQTMYAILGWEGHNKMSNKKVIECMYFNSKGEPHFGKSVFESERNNKRRVIFEYSKEAYMTLRYNEDLKKIVFNELAPMKPELKGIYAYYIPTSTYLGYAYKKDTWVLVQDLKPENEKNDKPWLAPRKQKVKSPKGNK
jgi:hypothetical protein